MWVCSGSFPLQICNDFLIIIFFFFHYSRSPHYASPEVVQGITYDGEKADIWSCGVILYALVSGKLPFDNENIRVLLGKVKTGVFTMPAFLPKDVQDLIAKMLVVDPKKRISMEGIRNHPWYNSIPIDTVEPTAPLDKVKYTIFILFN